MRKSLGNGTKSREYPHMPDTIYELVIFQKTPRKENLSVIHCNSHEKKTILFPTLHKGSDKTVEEGDKSEAGVAERVIWRNSHKGMLRPNESINI